MADESSERTGLALGIEKIGLLSLNYPIAAAIVAVIVVVIAIFGESVVALHALSAVFTALAMWLFFALAQRLAPDHALLATGFFVLSPGQSRSTRRLSATLNTAMCSCAE